MTIIPFISSWLKDIVILFALITIAELIMPNGNMKKYINLVIGLLIIFTIINPLVRLMNLDFDIDKAVMNYYKDNEIISNEVEEFNIQQDKQIENIFKEKLRNEISTLIEDKTDYKVLNIAVSIFVGEENFGEIDRLEILIGEASDANKGDIAIQKIQKVEIEKDRNREKIVGNSDFNEIKELVYDNFLVEKDRITIIKKGIGE